MYSACVPPTYAVFVFVFFSNEHYVPDVISIGVCDVGDIECVVRTQDEGGCGM